MPMPKLDALFHGGSDFCRLYLANNTEYVTKQFCLLSSLDSGMVCTHSKAQALPGHLEAGGAGVHGRWYQKEGDAEGEG